MEITQKIEINNLKFFTIIALGIDNIYFVLYIVVLIKLITFPIYSFYLAKSVFVISVETKISIKYFNFSDISFSDSTVELIKYFSIRNHLFD